MYVQSRSHVNDMDSEERLRMMRDFNSESKAVKPGKALYHNPIVSRRLQTAILFCALVAILIPVGSFVYSTLLKSSLRVGSISVQHNQSSIANTAVDSSIEPETQKTSDAIPSSSVEVPKSLPTSSNKSTQASVEDKPPQTTSQETAQTETTETVKLPKNETVSLPPSTSPLPSPSATSGLPQWVIDHFLDDKGEASKRPQLSAKCNLWEGKWVYDKDYPLWDWASCPFGDEIFNCGKLGNRDMNFTKLRWQPSGCNIDRFDAKDFRERMRGKGMVIVGDSLGRNQFVSLLCMAAQGANTSKIYEKQGGKISKSQLFVVYVFEEFNFTLEYYRSPWLVTNKRPPQGTPDPPANAFHVTKRCCCGECSGVFFSVASEMHFEIDMKMAFHRIMRTIAEWSDNLTDPRPTVYFRGYSPVHFTLGDWNTGGKCTNVVPKWNQSETEDLYYTPMAKEVISRMKTPFQFLDILRLSAMRNDAHIGKMRNSSIYDCSHWCLPGVPDVWNELWLAVLRAQKVPPFV